MFQEKGLLTVLNMNAPLCVMIGNVSKVCEAPVTTKRFHDHAYFSKLFKNPSSVKASAS